MIISYAIAIVIATAVTGAAFYRILAGPTVFDRLLAAGATGTNAIAVLAIAGFLFDRPEMFVDLALSYALLNFIGAVAIGRYFEGRRRRTEDDA